MAAITECLGSHNAGLFKNIIIYINEEPCSSVKVHPLFLSHFTNALWYATCSDTYMCRSTWGPFWLNRLVGYRHRSLQVSSLDNRSLLLLSLCFCRCILVMEPKIESYPVCQTGAASFFMADTERLHALICCGRPRTENLEREPFGNSWKWMSERPQRVEWWGLSFKPDQLILKQPAFVSLFVFAWVLQCLMTRPLISHVVYTDCAHRFSALPHHHLCDLGL